MRYIILVLTFFLTQCDKSDEIIIDSRLGKADQESWGVTILLTDEGLIKAKIKSGHLEKYNEREFILLDSNVTVDFFDEDENHTSTLMCNIAEVNEKGRSEILVSGHTDDKPLTFGSIYRDNWDLAAARASSVVQAMQSGGVVSADRLQAVSFGEAKPIADNQTAAGSEKNRRIEIEIQF